MMWPGGWEFSFLQGKVENCNYCGLKANAGVLEVQITFPGPLGFHSWPWHIPVSMLCSEGFAEKLVEWAPS